MSRVVKRSAPQSIESGRSRRGVPVPQFITPQLSQPVEKPPSGPQWLHKIKLDGFPRAQLRRRLECSLRKIARWSEFNY